MITHHMKSEQFSFISFPQKQVFLQPFFFEFFSPAEFFVFFIPLWILHPFCLHCQVDFHTSPYTYNDVF